MLYLEHRANHVLMYFKDQNWICKTLYWLTISIYIRQVVEHFEIMSSNSLFIKGQNNAWQALFLHFLMPKCPWYNMMDLIMHSISPLSAWLEGGVFCWGRAWQLSVLNFKKEGSEKKTSAWRVPCHGYLFAGGMGRAYC